MAAVRQGVGRETAHEAIKEHAVAVALAMREQGAGRQRPARPARRRRAPRPRPPSDLQRLVAEPLAFTGAAVSQVAAVVAQVEEIMQRHPEAAAYTPGAIL